MSKIELTDGRGNMHPYEFDRLPDQKQNEVLIYHLMEKLDEVIEVINATPPIDKTEESK
jgi:hypothetical protein